METDRKPIFHLRKENYLLTNDNSKLQEDVVLNYLKRSYWAAKTPPEVIIKSIKNSLCFSLFEGDKQIGFARVITDYARFAYFADVFILEEWRGKGLSKWMLNEILNLPVFKNIKWMLATSDAHKLYTQFGFEMLMDCEKYMIRKPADN
ncbi:MAG TPA: GNAT family N-acetyltransferase [Ignavibacteriaceae bacterium]|nr:GNAT family N-acetyltransferase [Ignavibacteriaceae bacterium]